MGQSALRTFTDMMGREVDIPFPPRRIVSLVPSQTELLYDLGLDEEVVGITKFCVHPETWFRSKKRVGGTKTLHTDIIKALQPDLIIANKEENTKGQIEELAALYSVWISDIQSIDDGLQMIKAIGEITCTEKQAADLVNQIKAGFDSLGEGAKQVNVAYFIWRNPWMCAGGHTFISNMINAIGWSNVLSDKLRYPEINLDELKERNVDLILLSSEPYPFKHTHIAEIRAVLPQVAVRLVDGEMFSWYGSRMLKAIPYLAQLKY